MGRATVNAKVVAFSMVAALVFWTTGSALAQSARIADFVGEWEGTTSTGVDLSLRVDPDGAYHLRWLTGPGAGSAPTGATTLRDNNLVVKYRDGEMVLAKRPDGTLAGPYATERSRGTVGFSRPGSTAPLAPEWVVGKWQGTYGEILLAFSRLAR